MTESEMRMGKGPGYARVYTMECLGAETRLLVRHVSEVDEVGVVSLG